MHFKLNCNIMSVLPHRDVYAQNTVRMLGRDWSILLAMGQVRMCSVRMKFELDPEGGKEIFQVETQEEGSLAKGVS